MSIERSGISDVIPSVLSVYRSNDERRVSLTPTRGPHYFRIPP
jgi:hypothetical protein